MTGAIAFERAGAAQEHEVRAILRDVPLGGDWSIALTREPDGLGGLHLPGERQDIILARDSATGAAVSGSRMAMSPKGNGRPAERSGSDPSTAPNHSCGPIIVIGSASVWP